MDQGDVEMGVDAEKKSPHFSPKSAGAGGARSRAGSRREDGNAPPAFDLDNVDLDKAVAEAQAGNLDGKDGKEKKKKEKKPEPPTMPPAFPKLFPQGNNMKDAYDGVDRAHEEH